MYTPNEKSIIWLSLFEQLTLSKINKLLNYFGEPYKIIENLISAKPAIINIVGENIYHKMLETDSSILSSYINNLDKNNIKCLTICSEKFPNKLRDINECPVILFYKGNIDLLDKKGVAIVGTRNPTAYGRTITEDFAKSLAKKGLVIISGLASGVDKFAHNGALSVGGSTIAVLGGGFDNIYPAMNTNLAKEIAEKGLLISEYRPNLSPTKYSFPYRNRIISALSDGVLITEAGEKSGALHTKNYAIEQGKDLFVIPANINNLRALGSNKLLKSLQGACVLEPDDILLHYNLPLGEEKKVKQVQTNITEQAILEALSDGNQTLETLQDITKLEIKSLNSCLTMLQIRGLIKKLPGNEYSL